MKITEKTIFHRYVRLALVNRKNKLLLFDTLIVFDQYNEFLETLEAYESIEEIYSQLSCVKYFFP